MKNKVGRWYFLIIALVAVLLVGALAMLTVDRAMRASAVNESEIAAEGDAQILSAGLESELSKFSLVPQVLAFDPEVAALLAGDDRQLSVLNRRFADLAEKTGAAAIYLMDADGLTLAASNWDAPTSFVGSNYGFRDYFAGAIENGSFTEFALGTVSRRPGLYIAQSVETDGRPLGVIAVKVEFDALERKWRDAQLSTFVTDPDGIIIITSNPDWRFRATRALADNDQDPDYDQLRFGTSSIDMVPFPDGGPATSSIPLIEKIQPISPTGWELHLLADPAPRLAGSIANGRLFVLLALILLGGFCVALFLWVRRREAQATDLMRMQTAALRDQLQQANRLATLGQVSAGVSHEIRQPVAAVRVFAENGERLLALGKSAEAAENFAKITQLTARIGQITEELLQFSRRTVRDPKQITLAEVIEGSFLLLRDQVERYQAVLVLPSPELADTRVRAEHVRLEQVLVNLLQNALQVSGQRGRIAIEITVEAERCLLTVADNGPGIDAGVRRTLFQPFVTTKAEGIGLGLAISRDIMRDIGGDLVFEDGGGDYRGARFSMVIPLA